MKERGIIKAKSLIATIFTIIGLVILGMNLVEKGRRKNLVVNKRKIYATVCDIKFDYKENK